MSSIISYGCVTAAGTGVEPLWQSLQQGRSHESSHYLQSKESKYAQKDSQIFSWPDQKEKPRSELVKKLLMVFEQVEESVGGEGSLGVILCSTKGYIEDFVWDENLSWDQFNEDPYQLLLADFLKEAKLKPQRHLCVSNACASSLAGMFLADSWINLNIVEQVLVLSIDHIGPFIYNGFCALDALSETSVKPFDNQRDGLQLGEASSAILLGKKGPFKLAGVGLDTEGYAVSRPNKSGDSLVNAYNRIQGKKDPDLIIAHGTATKANDETEDAAFSRIFSHQCPPITASKWCVGHTLAASGSIDTIAACEAIRRQKVFSLPTTQTVSKEFAGNYLTADDFTQPQKVDQVLVSSLGFGGTHALALISKGDSL